MKIEAKTVAQYLGKLPDDRREVIEEIRLVIRENIDEPFAEGIQYGMIGYFLPHSAYPAGYHVDPSEPLPFASIASQKNHIGLYLFCVYMNDEIQAWFRDAWTASGRKLDMGKSCVRVKKLEDVPLDVVGALFRKVSATDFIASYEAARPGRQSMRKSAGKPSTSKGKRARSAVKKKAARRRP